MRFSCSVAELRAAIDSARRTIVANPPMIAYTAMLLQVKGANLLVTGSDGETTVTTEVPLTGERAKGSVLVLPKALAAWLGRVDDKATITATLDDAGDLRCEAGGSPYTFRPMTASYPEPSGRGAQVPETAGDTALLVDAVAAVRHASDGSVRLHSSGENLTVTATDNYRLAQVTVPGVGFGDREGVAALATLDQITRHAPLTHLGIDAQGRELRARSERVQITARLEATPFPAVDGVLSEQPVHTTTLDSGELRAALERLAPLAGRTPAVLTVTGTNLTIDVSNTELGSGSETVTCAAAGEFECGIDLTYLRDAASAQVGDRITLGWSSPQRALRVQSTAGVAIDCLLMPIKLS